MQVHLLVGVLAEVVAGNVAGDDHQRNAVQGRIGHPGGRIGQPGAEVAQHHCRPAGEPGVAVGGMGGDLLMTDVDEADGTLFQGRQHGDVGVPAQPEDMLQAAPFEIIDKQLGNGFVHGTLP